VPRLGHTYVLLLLAIGCGAGTSAPVAGPHANLLAGRSPLRSEGVVAPARLTDGRAAHDGDFWKTEITTVFESSAAYVVYDLGSRQRIAAAWLQGDNNDTYELAISDEGQTFASAWRAGPQPGSGLHERHNAELDASGRYVRISATGGDGAFALSEVQVFSDPHALGIPLTEKRGAAVQQQVGGLAVLPPGVTVVSSTPLDQQVRDRVLIFGLALMVLMLLGFRGMPLAWALVLAVPALASGILLASTLRDAWPLGMREVSLVRGTLAAIAAVVVLRETFGAGGRFPASRRLALGLLGFCAVGSLLAFYNLGQPQFYDAKSGRNTFVHYLDLRQYYATAKYFREIGYTGMYDADVAALIDDHPEMTVERLRGTPMRDLTTLQISTIERERDAIERVKSRFSNARWEAYKRDARYFRDTMGTADYLVYMQDMGGNATPVWIGIANLLFSAVPPSDRAFLATALFDLVLLIAAFVAIGRSFGLRTMFVCMVIFGANDFIMYGSNWAGATLRHDWLAYLGLGASALRRGRWMLGGAFLALSTMIRAFPALALMAATLPTLWILGEQFRQHRRLPSLAALRAQPIVRVLAGAAAAAAGAFLFSVLIVPIAAWPEWLRKVSQLSADPHANHISLRSLIAGWQSDQGDVLHARLPLFLTAVLGYVGLVVFAARGRRVDQAAVLGLILVPVLLYPANYYIHIVFLLPLLATERAVPAPGAPPVPPRSAFIWLVLLGMCVAQYFTVLETDRGLHFYFATVVLFAALTALLVSLVTGPARAVAHAADPAS
jgi:hypothetical protein